MRLATVLAATVFAVPQLAHAQAGAGANDAIEGLTKGEEGVQIVGHVIKPLALDWNEKRMAGLGLPEGFTIDVFADDLENPRMMDVADDGTLYVTRRQNGDVMMLRDTDGDGKSDDRQVVARKDGMHGIEIDGDTVYLMTVEEVYRASRNEDGTLGELELVAEDFPAGGQHPNRMVQMGPDGKLYLSVGSTCNACGETDPENATIVSMNADGSERSIFASGLRNTIGYGFEPSSGTLYGFDHGIDWLGDNEQHGEFNRIEEGERYGWPYVYGLSRPNPQDVPPDSSFEEYAANSVEPIGLHTPHAAPMQMVFYTGDAFPGDYQGDAFVAFRGSWNRQPPSGYEVMRVDFENGEPVAMEPFVTGFLMRDEESPTGWGHMGRLAGMTQGPDGALYLSDDTGGIIYRITYEGETAPDRPEPAFTNADSSALDLGLVSASRRN
ncbi:PQQ-dependent sugar dehydrogenase [Fulvimarina sp. 2208YS6-2-32]|uniref:PQQ-dependent sugar dehydrogenase n=1 Tax=Fulvimarina uroteuthidis TaxID=3098149 RepID=A0ABU5I435_9HYPH|nr:PQQ-dependent sugar dehydrogenase [Fulvimarina sp. 2208YS6-2-32]MDY8110145.1 PQQ-dependent sugar dehydrogenase [Fulvimarina sp. 2208YS6-2-32]